MTAPHPTAEEREAWRKLADEATQGDPFFAPTWDESIRLGNATIALGQASRTAVPALLDALAAAEARADSEKARADRAVEALRPFAKLKPGLSNFAGKRYVVLDLEPIEIASLVNRARAVILEQTGGER